MDKHLRFSLANGASFFPTTTGETALSICLDKSFNECISAIFKAIDKMAKENIFVFYYFEQSIKALNYNSFSDLDKFYRGILIKSPNPKLPKFCKDSVKLPIVIYDDFIMPNSENFMSSENYTAEGKAIIFLQTLVKMNLSIGSTESLEFLASLEDCTDVDSFDTPIIKTILREKWIRVSWVIDIQALLYGAYLALLALYSIKYQFSKTELIAPFCISFVLSLYELYLMKVAGIYY